MRTIYLNDTLTETLSPCVATIGFFDGVHRGHRYLIDHVKALARQSGLQSTVITFDLHPRQVLQSNYQPRLLTSLDRKLQLLGETGVDNVVVIHFTPQVAALTAHDFMADILQNRLNVRQLVIGYDNRFGHNRTDGFDDYVRYGQELGIQVIRSRAYVLHGINVSSSVIRELIADGDMERARECLGYAYTIDGTVVHGRQIGRRMGYPTANVRPLDANQMLPRGGVYAVRVFLSDADRYSAMLNIGTRPTFDDGDVSIEAHLFDCDQDLYGQRVSVCFDARVREEHRFDNAGDLQRQLDSDEQVIRTYYANHK